MVVSTASTAKIYRWVDANGVVQYSDQPPAKQQAETISVRGARKPESKAGNGPDAPKARTELAPAEKPAQPVPETPSVSPEQQAAIDAARAENCRRARSNQQFLQDNPPRRLLDTDEAGRVYRLSVEDHTARMQKASDAIAEYCDG